MVRLKHDLQVPLCAKWHRDFYDECMMADPTYVNVDDFTEFIQSNFRNEESTTTSVTGTKTKGDAVIQYLKGVCGQE